MNKNKIGLQINHKANLIRTISTKQKLNYSIGDYYCNNHKCESWQDRDKMTHQFEPWNILDYIYVFYCDNVPCHLVDYNNIEECRILQCLDCNGEVEVLVPANYKMQIVDITINEKLFGVTCYKIELTLINE